MESRGSPHEKGSRVRQDHLQCDIHLDMQQLAAPPTPHNGINIPILSL